MALASALKLSAARLFGFRKQNHHAPIAAMTARTDPSSSTAMTVEYVSTAFETSLVGDSEGDCSPEPRMLAGRTVGELAGTLLLGEEGKQ
mmetsp:Transcript_49442/g.97718  ORF Transcript_49442/g.97718 Transcript_49442/m.97718 type:complete len:90 (-) Transcript_49442:677-946(-)